MTSPNEPYVCVTCGHLGMRIRGSPRQVCMACLVKCSTSWVPDSREPCAVCGAELGLHGGHSFPFSRPV